MVSTCGAVTPEASRAEIESWIDGLQSEQRSIRAWATQKLLDGGNEVVQRLAERLITLDLESSIHGLEILRTLALQEIAASSQAEIAIAKIAENRVASASTRAREMLRTISATRTQRAEKILSQLGVEFSMTAVSGTYTYAVPVVRTVTFDERWSGNVEDLVYLNWLADRRDISIEANGDQIDDAWLRTVAQVENVVSLKLGRCSVTDKGMEAIQDMRRLRDIRIYYTDVSDAWLPQLHAKPSSLRTLSVFGSRITGEAMKELAKQRPELITRHGVGGFLGIRGQPNPNGEGCLVTDVTANAAASKADIRAGDWIVEYDGHVVTEFMPPQLQAIAPVIPIEQPLDDSTEQLPSLSELIGKNAAGERVKVKIKRGGRYLVKEVELGEWR